MNDLRRMGDLGRDEEVVTRLMSKEFMRDRRVEVMGVYENRVARRIQEREVGL